MINFYNYHKEQLDLVDLYTPSLHRYECGGIHEYHDWTPIKHIFKREADTAYHYARYIIKGRWPDAEPYIMKDSYYAYCYAAQVITGKWPEAEPYIKQNLYWWQVYCKEFEI